jgi:hypothetical protein
MQLLVIHFTIKMFHVGFMQVLIFYSLKSQRYKVFKTLKLSHLKFYNTQIQNRDQKFAGRQMVPILRSIKCQEAHLNFFK